MSSSEVTLTEERTAAPATESNGRAGHATGPARNGASSEPTRDEVCETVSSMLGATDPATARHSDDVELLAGEVCDRLGVEGEERETLLMAARLHDVGKVSIPKEVLEKPDRLDAEEWRLIKQHTVVGERIVASFPELACAAPLVRHSHENFDGSGYPDGLRGDDIPLGSRIIFCVDAFHAIRCDRPYRRGRSTRSALAEIKRNAGSQFDPKVVQALAEAISTVRRPAPRRVPPRVAMLFAALAIGTGGAYAAERGWVPSPVPGLGPESSSDQGPDEAATSPTSGDSASSEDVRARESEGSRVQGNENGDGAAGKAGDGGNDRGGQGRRGDEGSKGGSAPGHGGSDPGNSGSAQGSPPGQTGSNSGQSASAPGQTGSTPGQSASTPGQSGSAPGQSGSNPVSGGGAPGPTGLAPGQSASTPGQSGATPGQSGSIGHSAPVSGNSAAAPDQNKP